MASIADLVENWLEWDKDDTTRAEIIKLRDAGDNEELEKRLAKRIAFGTAGLRGRMQAGFGFMNSLTVIQASQGLAKYIKEGYEGEDAPLVIIGHDARHNSAKFATLAANAFLAQGIKVLAFPSHVPTPHVPFAVLERRAAAGIVVTASHNPAYDNGYKVYLGNGAQLNTPADKEITQRIDDNLEPWALAWNDPKESELYTVDMSATVKEAYISKVKSYVESFGFGDIKAVPFVYTPMHGVGYRYFNQLCDEFKIKDWAVVEEQKEPDPDFPTVSFPNPEEHGALDLAMETADRLGRNLILANDPDADRFAVAEKVDGKWHRFSGDQVGVLLASYLLESFIELRRDRKKTAVLTTAVSSAMLHKMADSYGLLFEETLTGFKWLAKETQRLEKQGYSVPFAYEEALGYMFPAVSYDKDGLLAAMVFLAAATKWRKDGSTPASKLEQLYNLYGYHQTLNTYFVSPDKDTTNQLFARIRERPPHARNMIASFPVVRARDMTKGFDSGTMDGVPKLPVDASSQMLTVWSLKGVRFTLRGSGTEPKVKLYIESTASSSEEASKNVSGAFTLVLENWIKAFAPGMKYAPKQITSSGYEFVVDEQQSS